MRCKSCEAQYPDCLDCKGQAYREAQADAQKWAFETMAELENASAGLDQAAWDAFWGADELAARQGALPSETNLDALDGVLGGDDDYDGDFDDLDDDEGHDLDPKPYDIGYKKGRKLE